jgi:hypothetical protein
MFYKQDSFSKFWYYSKPKFMKISCTVLQQVPVQIFKNCTIPYKFHCTWGEVTTVDKQARILI